MMQRLTSLLFLQREALSFGKNIHCRCSSLWSQPKSSTLREVVSYGLKSPVAVASQLTGGWLWARSLPLVLTRHISLLTSFNVVDNSKLGKKSRRYKKPYLIGFYRKRRTADIGDVIKVAVQGKTCKAVVVATRKPKWNTIPRFDNNNIVLVDDNLAPLGTRIKGPLPVVLRKHRDKYSKILSLATRFV